MSASLASPAEEQIVAASPELINGKPLNVHDSSPHQRVASEVPNNGDFL